MGRRSPVEGARQCGSRVTQGCVVHPNVRTTAHAARSLGHDLPSRPTRARSATDGARRQETDGARDDRPMSATTAAPAAGRTDAPPGGPAPRRVRPPRWLDLRLVLGVLLVLGSVLVGARVVGAAVVSVSVLAVSGFLVVGSR